MTRKQATIAVRSGLNDDEQYCQSGTLREMSCGWLTQAAS
jgi:hypothetical protein